MTFEELLEKDGRIVYTNKGVSMLPLLREGKDIMHIETLQEKPKVYDAVLFKRPGVVGRGAYVLHRVMRINPDGTYFIIGDNCITGENVKEENILGLLTSVIRNGKVLDMNDKNYIRFVHFWWFIFPLRKVYKRMKAFVYRVGSFVKRKVLKIK